MNTIDWQRWINDHHPNGVGVIVADGKWGPATRAATIEVFRNRSAPAVSELDINKLAIRLGCDPRQIKAVAKVESAGGGWDDTGLLKALWERHWLWKRVRIAVPFLSNPSPGGYTIDADHDGICDSWEKVADAAGRFGFDVAAECASFGKFQIMGGHWKSLGYPSVRDFIWQLSQTEFAHYDAFARFIERNGLVNALRRIDGNPENARPFAGGYNGSGYAKLNYHGKIAFAWRTTS